MLLGSLSVRNPGKEFLMQIKFLAIVFKKGPSPPRFPVSRCVWLLHNSKLFWMVTFPVHAAEHSTERQNTLPGFAVSCLQNISFCIYSNLTMDFESQTHWVIQKQNTEVNPLKKRLGWMCMKKSLGKYRNSEQQFSTCSAVSCIYWTLDVIISSAVFFHNVCERTCPNSTPEYGKNVRAALLTSSVMKRRKKISTWTDQWHSSRWREVLKPAYELKSLYPLFQTLFTQLWPEAGPKNLNQLPIAHQWDLWSLGSQHARAHTHMHMCHRDQPTPADRMGRQDPAAGMQEKWKGLC